MALNVAITDEDLLAEIERRLKEKTALIKEMEFMTKKLLELNERSKQSESIKDEFLSLIKNEFNNPISSLLNLAKILEDKKNQDKFDSIIAMLNSELLKLDFHLRNIFATIEIEEGLIQSHYSDISFETIYQDVVSAFKYLIAEKNLCVVLPHCEDSGFVSDANKIFIILLNLVSNACEYSFPDSKIGVNIKKSSDHFIITVEDTGEGIDLQYSKQIFTRFGKFGESKTRTRAGLGLGLSVVRGLVESLDGSVDFESIYGNTIFTIKLPIIERDKVASQSVGSDEFIFDDFNGNESVEL